MNIKKTPEGTYQINNEPIRDLISVPGAVHALKKPIPITAKKINEPFTVDTSEGTMSGKAGDWLMQGINGEMYICPAAIFEMSYDIIK